MGCQDKSGPGKIHELIFVYNKKVFILVRFRPQGLLGFENENILGTSLQIFRQMVSIRVKTLSNKNLAASRHIKREKAHFRLTLRHSKTPLLKPPNETGRRT